MPSPSPYHSNMYTQHQQLQQQQQQQQQQQLQLLQQHQMYQHHMHQQHQQQSYFMPQHYASSMGHGVAPVSPGGSHALLARYAQPVTSPMAPMQPIMPAMNMNNMSMPPMMAPPPPMVYGMAGQYNTQQQQQQQQHQMPSPLIPPSKYYSSSQPSTPQMQSPSTFRSFSFADHHPDSPGAAATVNAAAAAAAAAAASYAMSKSSMASTSGLSLSSMAAVADASASVQQPSSRRSHSRSPSFSSIAPGPATGAGQQQQQQQQQQQAPNSSSSTAVSSSAASTHSVGHPSLIVAPAPDRYHRRKSTVSLSSAAQLSNPSLSSTSSASSKSGVVSSGSSSSGSSTGSAGSNPRNVGTSGSASSSTSSASASSKSSSAASTAATSTSTIPSATQQQQQQQQSSHSYSRSASSVSTANTPASAASVNTTPASSTVSSASSEVEYSSSKIYKHPASASKTDLSGVSSHPSDAPPAATAPATAPTTTTAPGISNRKQHQQVPPLQQPQPVQFHSQTQKGFIASSVTPPPSVPPPLVLPSDVRRSSITSNSIIHNLAGTASSSRSNSASPAPPATSTAASTTTVTTATAATTSTAASSASTSRRGSSSAWDSSFAQNPYQASGSSSTSTSLPKPSYNPYTGSVTAPTTPTTPATSTSTPNLRKQLDRTPNAHAASRSVSGSEHITNFSKPQSKLKNRISSISTISLSATPATSGSANSPMTPPGHMRKSMSMTSSSIAPSKYDAPQLSRSSTSASATKLQRGHSKSSPSTPVVAMTPPQVPLLEKKSSFGYKLKKAFSFGSSKKIEAPPLLHASPPTVLPRKRNARNSVASIGSSSGMGEGSSSLFSIKKRAATMTGAIVPPNLTSKSSLASMNKVTMIQSSDYRSKTMSSEANGAAAAAASSAPRGHGRQRSSSSNSFSFSRRSSGWGSKSESKRTSTMTSTTAPHTFEGFSSSFVDENHQRTVSASTPAARRRRSRSSVGGVDLTSDAMSVHSTASNSSFATLRKMGKNLFARPTTNVPNTPNSLNLNTSNAPPPSSASPNNNSMSVGGGASSSSSRSSSAAPDSSSQDPQHTSFYSQNTAEKEQPQHFDFAPYTDQPATANRSVSAATAAISHAVAEAERPAPVSYQPPSPKTMSHSESTRSFDFSGLAAGLSELVSVNEEGAAETAARRSPEEDSPQIVAVHKSDPVSALSTSSSSSSVIYTGSSQKQQDAQPTLLGPFNPVITTTAPPASEEESSDEDLNAADTLFPKNLDNITVETIRTSLERAKSLERRRSRRSTRSTRSNKSANSSLLNESSDVDTIDGMLHGRSGSDGLSDALEIHAAQGDYRNEPPSSHEAATPKKSILKAAGSPRSESSSVVSSPRPAPVPRSSSSRSISHGSNGSISSVRQKQGPPNTPPLGPVGNVPPPLILNKYNAYNASSNGAPSPRGVGPSLANSPSMKHIFNFGEVDLNLDFEFGARSNSAMDRPLSSTNATLYDDFYAQQQQQQLQAQLQAQAQAQAQVQPQAQPQQSYVPASQQKYRHSRTPSNVSSVSTSSSSSSSQQHSASSSTQHFSQPLYSRQNSSNSISSSNSATNSMSSSTNGTSSSSGHVANSSQTSIKYYPQNQRVPQQQQQQQQQYGSYHHQAQGQHLKHSSVAAPAMPRTVNFSKKIIIFDTYDGQDYDRRAEPATCNRLTPLLAQQIKEELNNFKMEMNVHAESRIYTHFF